MTPACAYLSKINLILLAMALASLVIKIVLFYNIEKDLDCIRFLHFSKTDLKMTINKDLRKWRKRQNMMTTVFLISMLLFAMSSLFYILISGWNLCTHFNLHSEWGWIPSVVILHFFLVVAPLQQQANTYL